MGIFQNQDGKLSKDEFREGSKCDPWIVQALSMEVPQQSRWLDPPIATATRSATYSAGPVITPAIFSKIIPKDTPYLARRAIYGVSFVSLISDLCSVLVTAVLYVISSHIGLRYNGTTYSAVPI